MLTFNNNSKKPLLALVGPTAVGKTALAIKVAQRLNTEIISADSAQVYRQLDIGTAKPSPGEQKAVTHHLINLIDPDQPFSVADYQKLAYDTIDRLWSQSKLPFMVGGTGLYINAVIYRYAFGLKGTSAELRKTYEQIADTEGLDQLYARLRSLDPEAATKIHPNDRKRIIRALEVYTLENKPISEQVTETGRQEQPYHPLIFALYMDREKLYRRIEDRVDNMLARGWLEEVRKLIRRGYNENDPGMQILGYRQLLDYLKGKRDWEETRVEIKKQTRNLAKRQLTWFRRNKNITWLEMSKKEDLHYLTENICNTVKEIYPCRANINI
ncbi:MAG: tRNA (adenosine(37)-N6)-dimethylallyltransferase MiaA [Bacillota bacterium]